MSDFAVRIERISEVRPHGNADRLELATLVNISFQFCVPKGEYKPGDLVVYFPIDSVLPDPLIEKLGLTGKLSGAQKNRVKTIRLRGAISQGIVAKPETLFSLPVVEGADVTAFLGVTKYESPEFVGGNLGALPELVSVYDIEGCERHADILEKYLMDTEVCITEKLEGSHFSISLYADDHIVVCQRRHSILEAPGVDKEHTWLKVADNSGLREVLVKMRDWLYYESEGHIAPIEVLTIRGEVIGPNIQGNIYKLNIHEVRVFEIEENGAPLPAWFYLRLIDEFKLLHAPVYARDITLRQWLDAVGCMTVAEASNGKSVLNANVQREGIVVKPMQEIRDKEFGRVFLKQRSPIYLAESDL